MTLDELKNNVNIIVLENRPKDPKDPENGRYLAILKRSEPDHNTHHVSDSDGAWVLRILSDFHLTDDWQGTPGQWYLDTLLGFDGYSGGRTGDTIYIDYGAKWYLIGMEAVLKEAEEEVYGKLDEALEFDRTGDPLRKMGVGIHRPLHRGDRVKMLSRASKKPFSAGTVLRIQTNGDIVIDEDDAGEIVMPSDMIIREREEARYTNIQPGSDMRNWYQKPESKSGYKKPQPLQLRKITQKERERIIELEDEIADLGIQMEQNRQQQKDLEMEREQFDSDVQERYGWDVLDILNSGQTDDYKIDALKEKNLMQDEKDKEIRNPAQLVSEYNYYWVENSEEKFDQEEEKLNSQIEKLQIELEKLEELL